MLPFSQTVRSSKLCMVIALLVVCIFIVDLMTLTLFQGHRCVKNMKGKTVLLFLFLFRFLSTVV